MTTSHMDQPITSCLYLAMELSLNTWKLAFSIGAGQKPRRRDIGGGDFLALSREICRAKKRFELPEDAPVICCYEAGRDGFWIHRYLTSTGIRNVVVDSSSIEVNRRQRRAKSDRLDADKLLSMLIRWEQGEQRVWSVVHVPSEQDEDRRRLHRELQILKGEHTRHNNRIKALLINVGIRLEQVSKGLPEHLKRMRQWDGQPLPAYLQQQLLREFERMQLVNQQIRKLEIERARLIRHGEGKELEMVRRLLEIRGLGGNSSWLFVMELFGWRTFSNRRQLAGAVGLAPTPYSSGGSEREQGITKSGNCRLRTMAIEIAWGWLRFQPHSELTQWYQRRFGRGGKRQRRVGIVALARKLMIVIWKYLKDGEITDGFELCQSPSAIPYTRKLT